jgi:hypothetical protein
METKTNTKGGNNMDVGSWLNGWLYTRIPGYEPYKGEIKCQGVWKHGKKCEFDAKYKQDGRYLCGHHINKKENKVELDDPPKKKETRKSCEHNAFELICALCLLYDNINTKDDVLSTDLSNCNKLCVSNKNFQLYLNDVKMRKKEDIKKFISNFKKSDQICPREKIKYVYLTGKSIKNEKIKQLNEEYDKKDVKSDVFIETTENNFIGMSVKQDSKCTKTNFSLYLFLDKEEAMKLTKIKLNMFKVAGYPIFRKNECNEINKLLRPTKDNLFWNAVKSYIEKYNNKIKEQMFNYIHCNNVSYPVYEYDGDKIHCLKKQRDGVNLEFNLLENYKKANGEDRDASKLYFKYREIDKKDSKEIQYRIELRFKNSNKHNGTSPQFQTHKE